MEFVWSSNRRRYGNVHVTRNKALQEVLFFTFITNFILLNCVIAYVIHLFVFIFIVGKMMNVYVK